jgi:hypothetical protein
MIPGFPNMSESTFFLIMRKKIKILNKEKKKNIIYVKIKYMYKKSCDVVEFMYDA